jgi:thimet oligopeptidase
MERPPGWPFERESVKIYFLFGTSRKSTLLLFEGAAMSVIARSALVMILFAAAGVAAGQEMPKPGPPQWNTNPDVAAFEKMEADRLAAAQNSIDQIMSITGSRTIENTLVPYDAATQQLDAAANISSLMQDVHPDLLIRDHATAMTARVSSAMKALSVNLEVYKALASLDLSKADPVTRYYVERQLLESHLSGVDTDDATRDRLKKLNDRLTDDASRFSRNVVDDTKIIEIADPSELNGLPQDFVDSHKPGADGKIRLTTNGPDINPVLDFANSDELRRRIWVAFNARAYPKNRDVLRDLIQVRYEIATLLGFSSWADYNAADKMILKSGNIADFVQKLDAATRPLAEREFALLLAEKKKMDPQAKTLWEYDRRHLEELTRRSKYEFDSEAVRPYLPYNQVKQGILDTAAKLFRVSFQQERNVPAWDQSVETWDVIDNGRMVGRFYLDMHPRPGKYGHAEAPPVLEGIRGKQMPEGVLVCNFPEPTANDPGLMDYADVVTFFHEFGHLMHQILGGQQPWAGIAVTNMELDFIEAPSQMLEEWMRSPQVLASFAHNYKTGEPIPGDLVARMNRAFAFGRATDVSRQNSLSALSYDIYKDKPENVNLDEVVSDTVLRYTLFKPSPGTHMYANFSHLAGYSSSYYTYMWDKVIAEDFFQQFDQRNLFVGDAPMRYRRVVLEPGGSMSANDLVRNFLGRPQNMDAFQRWLGEEFETEPKKDSAP